MKTTVNIHASQPSRSNHPPARDRPPGHPAGDPSSNGPGTTTGVAMSDRRPANPGWPEPATLRLVHPWIPKLAHQTEAVRRITQLGNSHN
jgi:hypothetical protein